MVYQLNDAREIRGAELEGETLVLSENDCRGLIDSVFRSGVLKLAQPPNRPAMILRTSVLSSDVIAVTRQRNDRYFHVRFEGCRFHGVFTGVDFGGSPKPERDGAFGNIQNCDFTDATLNECRFVNADARTMKFPRWPHAVLFDPCSRAADAAKMNWPGKLGVFMRGCTDVPAAFNAIVLNASSLARLVGCTEDEIKRAFEEFGGLVM